MRRIGLAVVLSQPSPHTPRKMTSLGRVFGAPGRSFPHPLGVSKRPTDSPTSSTQQLLPRPLTVLLSSYTPLGSLTGNAPEPAWHGYLATLTSREELLNVTATSRDLQSLVIRSPRRWTRSRPRCDEGQKRQDRQAGQGGPTEGSAYKERDQTRTMTGRYEARRAAAREGALRKR